MFAGSNNLQFSGEPRCQNVGGNYSFENTTIVLSVVVPNEQSSWNICEVLLVCLVTGSYFGVFDGDRSVELSGERTGCWSRSI
ncbi:hypothetical protein M378DRAFT_172652 [Amanita muscaria Koide BX008]|uniref:Uncharacterized protein n=1 Tax=Amanita muscaria (strain Koide BX008) TaxID=946122 RepID=A0A0C2S1H2_AMAMK|nr:hypothetical protein M378DRAFT_172652 [Amanita muscaria Koide BX008]